MQAKGTYGCVQNCEQVGYKGITENLYRLNQGNQGRRGKEGQTPISNAKVNVNQK